LGNKLVLNIISAFSIYEMKNTTR